MTARLATLAVALVAAACSGSAGGTEVPDGFVETGVDGVARFAHPKGWKEVDPSREPVLLQVERPASPSGGVPATVVQLLHGELKDDVVDADALTAIQLAEMRGLTGDLEVVAQRKLEVDGADAAKLVEATFETLDTGVRVTGYYVFVLDGEGNTVTFGVIGTDVDRDVALRIVDTLRLES